MGRIISFYHGDRRSKTSQQFFITMNPVRTSFALLIVASILMTGTEGQQVMQSLPMPMMGQPQLGSRVGYTYGVNGYSVPYGAGQTIQKQQTVHQVTQTRPAYGTYGGVMSPMSTGGMIRQPVQQHVQTTRVNQIRTVPMQMTGMSG